MSKDEEPLDSSSVVHAVRELIGRQVLRIDRQRAEEFLADATDESGLALADRLIRTLAAEDTSDEESQVSDSTPPEHVDEEKTTETPLGPPTEPNSANKDGCTKDGDSKGGEVEAGGPPKALEGMTPKISSNETSVATEYGEVPLYGEMGDQKEQSVYMKYDEVVSDEYGYLDLDGDELNPQHTEKPDALPPPTPATSNAPISNTVFNELFPTHGVTTQDSLVPGSFPDIEEFDTIGFVGSGYFGLVFKSTLRGLDVVLKVSKTKGEASNRADYCEWSVSERLNAHPNVLQIIGLCPSFRHPSYRRAGTTALISPWMENGGLRTFFDNRSVQDDDLVNVALGMIKGIRSLHEQRVVHRDIAVRNFLVDRGGRVLLCDFGLTEFIPEGDECLHPGNSSPEVRLPWRNIAPESFCGVFSPKSDIWMYGIALIELVANKLPWHNFESPKLLKEAFSTGIAPSGIELLPPLLGDIVRNCTRLEASQRPTADNIAWKFLKFQMQRGDKDCSKEARSYFFTTILDTSKAIDPREALANAAALGLLDAVKVLVAHYPTHVNATARVTFKLDLSDPANEISDRGGKAADLAPLHFAAREGHASVVDFLATTPGVDANAVSPDGYTALHFAARNGHLEVVQLLAVLPDSDANVNAVTKDGWTPLHWAANEGLIDVVEFLTSLASVDVNATTKGGYTVICLAALRGRLEVVRFLATLPNVNVNGATGKGYAAIHTAAQLRHVDVIKVLVALPTTDVGAVTKVGDTVLHISATKGDVDSVRYLTDLPHFDVNAVNNAGLTPLHAAVKAFTATRGHVDVVKLLVATPNVDVGVVTKSGHTAADLAAKRGNSPLHQEMLEALQLGQQRRAGAE